MAHCIPRPGMLGWLWVHCGVERKEEMCATGAKHTCTSPPPNINTHSALTRTLHRFVSFVTCVVTGTTIVSPSSPTLVSS